MTVTDADEVEVLLRLALSHPGRALARASAVLESEAAEPCVASAALQARGIVLRDRGETAEAIRELRRALVAARRCGRIKRVVDVQASLGAALVMAGRTEAGLSQLEAAAADAHGVVRATVLMRRAYVLSFLGRPDEALRDLRVAVAGFRRAGDVVWEARTLNNRCSVLTALGDMRRAERDVRTAEEMFTAAGQQLEAVHALHNRATLAYLKGDLPRAFTLYDRAELAYTTLGARSADLVVDRAQAYLAAGLTQDAVELTTRVLAVDPLTARHRAEVQLAAATASLADGDPAMAEQMARQARRAFARQGRLFWVDRCDLVAVQARFRSGRGVRLPVVRDLADRLVASRAEEAAIALLLAGRVAVERGVDGHGALASAARYRTRGSPLVRATGWLALALDRDLAQDRAGVLRAARRGLDALTTQRDVLGSTQLRALATRNMAELTTLALRHVLASGTARDLLIWSERARAAALATPALRPPHDPALAGQLAAMRAVARALDEARDRGTPTAELVARLARLEASIDRRRHRAGATDVGDGGRGNDAWGTGRHLVGTGRHLVGAGRDRVGVGPGLVPVPVPVAVGPDPVGAGPHPVGGASQPSSPDPTRAESPLASESGGGASPDPVQVTPRPRVGPRHLASAFDRRAVARVAQRLGGRTLVELVDVDDTLLAVVLRRGRARRVRIGSTSGGLAAVQRARFALRQLARGRSADLVGAAGQLERTLLGEAVGLLGDDSVVLVPPARLHHAPWALCPALAARPFTSSPSAGRWVAALEHADSTTARDWNPATALIAGPGLEGADAEVSELALEHPGAVVLRGPDATVPAALRAFGEAAVVHIAAHGRHRTDNPLFSSLLLADGPLTVHDLEALPRMPRRIVLSACDSGVMAAVGSDALLGLAEALLAQGTAGLVCAVSEVNDAATRPVMTWVHAALAAGLTPAEALLAAREKARGDLLATATAASFTSLGA